MADESIRKGGKIRDGESRTMKKLRLTSAFRVIKSEKVTGEFNVLDKSILDVWQAHDAIILCWLFRRAMLERTGQDHAAKPTRRGLSSRTPAPAKTSARE